MKEIKLKVCGMRDAANIGEVSKLAPEYMGFIFYPKSPRFVGDNFQIPGALPATVKRVGVFVNESTSVILKKCELLQLDYIQLHGDEAVGQCNELKQNGVGVIKVFSVDDQMDFERTRAYGDVADFFLFDTKGKYRGGNAETFNWNVLERYHQELPFFLSGGLSPDNVAGVTALKDMNLHALDVNSGVEVTAGLKDPEKIKQVKNKLISYQTSYL